MHAQEQMNEAFIIPQDFTLNRYGVCVRLADVQDSAFILSLRTDKKLSRYLHATDNDVAKQENWMREYKKREHAGQEYYFIYHAEGNDFGTNRIYNISTHHATCGSWVCKPGINPTLPIISTIILREIMYDILGYDYILFDVRKQNRQVQKMHLMLGAEQIGENDLEFLYKLSKESFYLHKPKVAKLIGLTLE